MANSSSGTISAAAWRRPPPAETRVRPAASDRDFEALTSSRLDRAGLAGMMIAGQVTGIVMKIFPLAFALAVLWILLSGHTEPLVVGSGVLSVIFVSWLALRMKVFDGESYPFALLPRLLRYWAWLLWEIVKSSVDTARRALGPKSAVQPVVFDAPATQRTDLGLVVHANSITLTPGTVSLELEEGQFRVHALHPDVAKDALESGMDARVPDYGDE